MPGLTTQRTCACFVGRGADGPALTDGWVNKTTRAGKALMVAALEHVPPLGLKCYFVFGDVVLKFVKSWQLLPKIGGSLLQPHKFFILLSMKTWH